MAKKRTKNKNKISKTVLYGIVFLVLFLIFVGAVLATQFLYKDKFFPGKKIASVNVGGKTKSEATKILNEAIQNYQNQPITIEKQGYIWQTTPKELGILFDSEIINQVFEKGRLNLTKGFLVYPFSGLNFPLEIGFDQNLLFNFIKDASEKINTSVSDASLEQSNGEVKIISEISGKRVSIAETIEDIKTKASFLKSDYELEVETIEPNIKKADLESQKEKIKTLLSDGIILNYQDQKWEIASGNLIAWLDLNLKEANTIIKIKNPLYVFEELKGDFVFELEEGKLKSFLATIAQQIDISPQNAVLGSQDGKLIIVQPGQIGRKLNQETSYQNIQNDFGKGTKSIKLVVEDAQPLIYEGNLDELGLKELVASGTSNFSGSPQNRIYNIKVGASKFQGVLIKPGETFSFNQNLGEVNAVTGFLPELVILQDKTVPQYGGGLCQVSSTMYRVALNAGFPIVERTNHAYPVRYYYPLGADATIYLPSPDLKFTNDTNNHILIQTETVGNTLRFDFYGTNPSRVVKFAGNENGSGAVNRVEDVSPYLFNYGNKGSGSVDALFWRFIYDTAGNLTKTDRFFSSYDTPTKYPRS